MTYIIYDNISSVESHISKPLETFQNQTKVLNSFVREYIHTYSYHFHTISGSFEAQSWICPCSCTMKYNYFGNFFPTDYTAGDYMIKERIQICSYLVYTNDPNSY